MESCIFDYALHLKNEFYFVFTIYGLGCGGQYIYNERGWLSGQTLWLVSKIRPNPTSRRF